jgi:hypothetical protein
MIKSCLILWERIKLSKMVSFKIHELDNETSDALKKVMKKNCKIQLVPPDTHSVNLAERAIQFFKNQFKAIVEGIDDSFPMKLCAATISP